MIPQDKRSELRFLLPISEKEVQNRAAVLRNADPNLPKSIYKGRLIERIGKSTTGALVLSVRHGQSRANLAQALENESVQADIREQLKTGRLREVLDSLEPMALSPQRLRGNTVFSLTSHGKNQMSESAEKIFHFLEEYKDLRRKKGQTGFLKIYFFHGDGVRQAEGGSIIKNNLRELFKESGVAVRDRYIARPNNSKDYIYFAPDIGDERYNEQNKGALDKYLVHDPMVRFLTAEDFARRRTKKIGWEKEAPVTDSTLFGSRRVQSLLRELHIPSFSHLSNWNRELSGESFQRRYQKIIRFDEEYFGFKKDPTLPSLDDPTNVFIFITSQSTMDILYSYLCRLSLEETYDMLSKRLGYQDGNAPKLQGRIGNGDQMAFLYERVFPKGERTTLRERRSLPFDLENPSHAYTFLGLNRLPSDEELQRKYGTNFLSH